MSLEQLNDAEVNSSQPMLQLSLLKFPILIVFAVAFLVYVPSLFNGFVVDDFSQVVENPWIKDVRSLPSIFASGVWSFQGRESSFYRPMMHVIYMMSYHIFGLKAWGFHLINVLMHAATSVLVFLTGLKLFRTAEPPFPAPAILSLVAGLVFATHPIHSEAVVWVAGAPDLSCALLYLLSFYLYVVSTDRLVQRKGCLAASIACFFVALFCKEPALTLPLLLFAYDLAHRHQRPILPARYIPYILCGFFYLVVRTLALKGFAPITEGAHLSLYEQVVNAASLFSTYVFALLLPVRLTFWHLFQNVGSFFTVKGAAGLGTSAAFLSLLWLTYRMNRVAFIALCFFVIPLLPAFYTLAIYTETAFAERYLYLPSAGFAMLLPLSGAWLWKMRPSLGAPLLVAVVLLIGGYSVASALRTQVWKDNYTLWSDAAMKEPDAPTPRLQLGYSLIYKGRREEGLAEIRRAVQLDPSLPRKTLDRGIMFIQAGLVEKAIFEFHGALITDPSLAEAHFNLGLAYEQKGWEQQAAKEYQAAIALVPDYAQAYNNLGILHAKRGEVSKALELFQIAVRLAPSDPDYRANLDKTLGKDP